MFNRTRSFRPHSFSPSRSRHTPSKLGHCFHQVVLAAPELQIVQRRFAAPGPRYPMVNFDPRSREASPTIRRSKGAPPSVTTPHGSPNVNWNMPRFRGIRGGFLQRPAAPDYPRLAPASSESLALELVDQQRQRQVENAPRVTIRNRVPAQLAGPLQFVAGGDGNGDVEPTI
jgi:hypothetical protein